MEHFADVISGLLHYPIGPEVAAQQGLEATPVGLAYHYVHATLSALGGGDAFGTALPAHFLMLALGVSGVYVFARSFMGLAPGGRCWPPCSTPGGPCPWWWPPSAGDSRRRRWPRCRWPWLPCAWG